MNYDKALYEMSKQWYAKQKKLRRIEREQSESIEYYRQHKEEIELGRKAALLIASLNKIAPIRELSIEDILCKITSFKELDFYYKWCCEVI